MRAYNAIMKRVATTLVIIVGLLAVAWLVLGFVKRVRQNNASVAMLVATAHLKEHVRVHGQWPRSWEELFPKGMADDQWVTRLVTVNWQMTLKEITDFVERVDIDDRQEFFPPPDIDLPFLVVFTDRVPRDESLAFSEREWNWMIAIDIYRERNEQGNGKVSP
jgi:type II secretory pathway pseudopilin PulG